MMSSFETSSPVSASTLAYLMRWPVLRLIWLKLIFSESEVAGYKATGQVTNERRKKPFQLARGAIQILLTLQNPDSRRSCRIGSDNRVFHWRHTIPNGLQALAELGPLSFSNLAAGGQNRQRPACQKEH